MIGSTLVAALLLWVVPAAAQSPRAPTLNDLVSSLDTPAAILVRRVSDGAEWTGGESRVDARFVPASTFKVASSLILLQTGVIEDPDHEVIPWDGIERGGAWDQDQTLRSAFHRSAYWAYAGLIQRVGHERVQDWVESLGYGDAGIGSPDRVGSFWLEGPLTISVREQVAFLDRVRQRQVPIDARHIDWLIDAMAIEAGPDWVLRGKTGWGRPPGQTDIGWFVGWLETPGDTWLFAVNLDMSNPDRHRHDRRRLAEAALTALGAYPSSPDR